MNPLLFLFLWHLAPLVGLATWYDSGDIMRNGEPLDLSASTVSVDASHVDWLGKTAIVLTECGVHLVTVTDTGNLYKAGRFRLGESRFTKQLRYWPVVDATPVLTNTIEWREEKTHEIVADFPRDFFLDKIACDGDETLEIELWILPRQ